MYVHALTLYLVGFTKWSQVVKGCESRFHQLSTGYPKIPTSISNIYLKIPLHVLKHPLKQTEHKTLAIIIATH